MISCEHTKCIIAIVEWLQNCYDFLVIKRKWTLGLQVKELHLLFVLYINKYKIVCTRVEINNACAFVRNK